MNDHVGLRLAQQIATEYNAASSDCALAMESMRNLEYQMQSVGRMLTEAICSRSEIADRKLARILGRTVEYVSRLRFGQQRITPKTFMRLLDVVKSDDPAKQPQ